tara:strand:+ start:311 stop:841 length:531 start_codon:yes stop_codon:yes gene_type:complete
MKITRGQLRRLISEVQQSDDTKSLLEAHATLSYFRGYVGKLLVHIRTADYPHEFSRMIGHIDILLSGLLEEVGMLTAHATAKVAEVTGTKLDKPFLESKSISQEAKENAEIKISESYGDAYAHLLTLAYDSNNVLGTMALVDAAYIISPGIDLFRLDGIETHLQFDEYLNAMDSLT